MSKTAFTACKPSGRCDCSHLYSSGTPSTHDSKGTRQRIALFGMRKGPGISALQRHTATNSSYASLSSSISASQLASLQTSLAAFRDHLQTFASQHRADIRKDPAFRHQFQKMCAAIGVDPLAGGGGGPSGRGGWGLGDILGLGEWQYELAVQVVDVCVSTRPRNGGTIELEELRRRVQRLRGPGAEVSGEDVLTALDILRPLGAGYAIQRVGGLTYVRSVPRELDTDQSALLVLATDRGGRLTEIMVRRQTGWPAVRCHTALEDCVMREGLAWVDEQGSDREYWFMAALPIEGAGG